MAVAFEIGVMLVFHFEIPATTSTCMAAVGISNLSCASGPGLNER